VVRSAPHSVVLPQARVVVAHGGHGTVMKSLAAGVPLLCVPLGRDQVDNATRVVVHGVGLMRKSSASSSSYRSALERLLEDPSYTESAGRLGERIRRDAAESSTLTELESLASRPVARAAA